MQRIKKLLLATCLFWAGASQVARADQNVNYIYKEKGVYSDEINEIYGRKSK